MQTPTAQSSSVGQTRAALLLLRPVPALSQVPPYLRAEGRNGLNLQQHGQGHIEHVPVYPQHVPVYPLQVSFLIGRVRLSPNTSTTTVLGTPSSRALRVGSCPPDASFVGRSRYVPPPYRCRDCVRGPRRRAICAEHRASCSHTLRTVSPVPYLDPVSVSMGTVDM